MEFKPSPFPAPTASDVLPVPVPPRGFKMPKRNEIQMEWMATITDKRQVTTRKVPMLLDEIDYPEANHPFYSVPLYFNTETHIPGY